MLRAGRDCLVGLQDGRHVQLGAEVVSRSWPESVSGNKLRAYPAQLSGGEKNRVGIARALAMTRR